VDILLEEVRKVFGNTDEGRLAERLIVAYRQRGARGAREVLKKYLEELGVDVADIES